MTKLRTRLKSSNLLSLADLKLHIRDQHLRDGSKRDIRQQSFGLWDSKKKDRNESSEDIPIDPVLSTDPYPDHDPDPTLAPNNSLDSDNVSNRTLETIQSALEQVALSENNNSEEARTWSPSDLQVKLSELFDFSESGWVEFTRRNAKASLEDEERIYDLLDLDAPDTESLDFDIDATTETVLTT